MGTPKDGSQPRGRGKARLPVGAVGLSLSLAGAACAESSPADASPVASIGNVRNIDLHEEEIFDTTLNSFRLINREVPEDAQSGKPYAAVAKRCLCSHGCKKGQPGGGRSHRRPLWLTRKRPAARGILIPARRLRAAHPKTRISEPDAASLPLPRPRSHYLAQSGETSHKAANAPLFWLCSLPCQAKWGVMRSAKIGTITQRC